MEIIGDTYRVTYDPATTTVTFQGKLRLYDRAAYEPIETLLDEVASTEAETITLDIQRLEFLNSSGIDLIHGFAIKVRNRAVSSAPFWRMARPACATSTSKVKAK